MNYNQITIGIVTFKSKHIIFDCLQSIKKIKNIIIYDNSNDRSLKKKINKKYPKIKIYLSNKNLGYGAANNKIIKKSKTPFVFILNPDVILKKNCEKNILKSINKLKKNFAIIAPSSQYNTYGFFNKKTFIKKKFYKVDFVGGSAMLLNKEKIENVGMFDENIFLYYEETDLFRRLKFNGENIYLDKNSKVNHLAAKSSNIGFEFEKCRNWHFMWSQVYYEKKYNNNFWVYSKFMFLIFILFLKLIFYSSLLNKREIILKSLRLSGIVNSLLGKLSWYRP